MKNIFNLNEEEKNRIRGLHGMQVLTEEPNINLLTPAVKNHIGKQVSSLKMLQIIAGCWINNKKSGELWAGLGPGGWQRSSKGGPFPYIYPGEKEGTVVGGTKTGWAETINPCKMSQIRGDMWTRSDFLVPGIVNFWAKQASGISNTPTDQYDDDANEIYSDKQIKTMEALGDGYTWVPGRNLAHNTMWTLTKV